MTNSDEEFDVQLRLEAREKELEQHKDEAAKEEKDEEAGNQPTTKTDPDGTVYEWDALKKAWFPKIDDDFIARYQMSYGSADTAAPVVPAVAADPAAPSASTGGAEQSEADQQAYWEYYNQYYAHYNSAQQVEKKKGEGEAQESGGPPKAADGTEQYDEDYWNYYYNYYNQNPEAYAEEEAKRKEEEEKRIAEEEKKKEEAEAEKKRKKEEGWFNANHEKSTSVYVSGLPTDITDEEFEEFMKKCGLILYDQVAKKLKVKLYKDKDGKNKGDGICGYIKAESVDLALEILDGNDIRGNRVTVERAKFELKGQYDPKKKRRKLTNKEKKRIKEKQEKLFAWRPDKLPGERPRSDRVVIAKNAFTPEQFAKDPTKINLVSQKMRGKCNQFGDVRKVKVHDGHVDGVVSVTMGTPEEADLAIKGLNGCLLFGRVISVETWDGTTRYDVKETEEELAARDAAWEKFLNEEEQRKRDEEERTTQDAQVDDTGQASTSS
ncbi:hypothetical protein CAPTEDRAFT_225820 [Capitella teleta]|uniref:17S U2 SnRNP complex component HTATSF1 n=1 Tax=Capitella teleta TaxID=283909 RepID=R7UDT8_CAPTE|nr:hypothetical protein CAPTEDRAFT_225820 [Capitella teleta]|eukprot:ELU04565.1 hypothetical protein CAPTEDRAFT_225820 [Capitella teleta]